MQGVGVAPDEVELVEILAAVGHRRCEALGDQHFGEHAADLRANKCTNEQRQ